MNKPFYSVEDIPTDKRDPDFWNDISKENNQHLFNYIIISALRSMNPDKMTSIECRTAITRLKTLQEMIDIKSVVGEYRDAKVEATKVKSSQQYFEESQ